MVWHSSVIELLGVARWRTTEKKSRRLKSHLEACRSCRSKARQIEENLRQSSSIAIQDDSVASRLDAAAKNLQRAIHTRRLSENTDPGENVGAAEITLTRESSWRLNSKPILGLA